MSIKYRMIYDENLCIGCQACSIACRSENNIPANFFRLQVRIETKGIFPNLKNDFIRNSCVMCENPPCVTVCPTGASYQMSNGLTFIDAIKCISCNYCVIACPYDARYVNPITKSIDKCTFCFSNRVSKNLSPACVTVCPTDALVFGDIDDMDSNVYKKSKEHFTLAPKKYLGTNPKLVFIPSKKSIL